MAVKRIDDHEAGRARRFLLGRLSAEETEQFELRMLADAELWEHVQAVKTELLDEYVRGALPEADRQVVASRFERSPQRIRFSGALANHPRPKKAARRPYWLASAAAVILVVIGVGVWQSPTPTPVTPAVATTAPELVKARPPITIEKIATLTLALATTRDDDAAARLTLAADVTAVALKIRLHPADRYPTYAVEVTHGNTIVWKGDAMAATANEIAIQIPAPVLPAGEYQIAVAGIDAQGQHEDLGDQTLNITRLR